MGKGGAVANVHQNADPALHMHTSCSVQEVCATQAASISQCVPSSVHVFNASCLHQSLCAFISQRPIATGNMEPTDLAANCWTRRRQDNSFRARGAPGWA
eukprot:1160756-Pelagomonas_calceolata.AAC.9